MPPPSAARPPRLSIVTALRDRAASLHANLPGWLALGDALAEIVVVDVGSAPGLHARGVLAVPKLVLVTLDDDAPLAAGLARNLGASVARGETLLMLDPELAIDDPESVAVGGTGFATAPPPEKGAPIPGAVLVGREAFARVGGYHEYLAGHAFAHDDLARRLAEAATPRRFLAPAALRRAPRTEPARIARVPPPDGPDWGGLERTALFEARRNRILAGLVPWRAELAALRPRRIGRIGERHHACALAPRPDFERRQRDVAAYLAGALLHDADPERARGAALVEELLESVEPEDCEAAATRQFQLDRLARASRGAARRGSGR